MHTSIEVLGNRHEQEAEWDKAVDEKKQCKMFDQDKLSTRVCHIGSRTRKPVYTRRRADGAKEDHTMKNVEQGWINVPATSFNKQEEANKVIPTEIEAK